MSRSSSAAGIHVYTTLNVQHVESLNDVVAQITGVIVRETVPDSILERADEIELIDLPPDDLLQRLQEGKVYVPEQAGRALEHFFSKGNLIALRELALRRTADRVDEQMQVYRRTHEITETWPTTERLLVCISPSPLSIRLVRATRRMAARLRAEWLAVYVETPAHLRLPEADRERVVHTLRLAEQLGAETVTLSGEHVSARRSWPMPAPAMSPKSSWASRCARAGARWCSGRWWTSWRATRTTSTCTSSAASMTTPDRRPRVSRNRPAMARPMAGCWRSSWAVPRLDWLLFPYP